MSVESKPASHGYWGHKPIYAVARAQRLTAGEIVELDRALRDTAGIERARIHAYLVSP